MNVPPAAQGNIFSIANAGLAIGALFFGLAVDVIGRKWAFNLTCLITSVFGLLLVHIVDHVSIFVANKQQGRSQVQL
jgi:MFS family permease